MKPVMDRLSDAVVPNLISLLADGVEVVARWDQSATARDGKRYANSYAWCFTMHEGKAIAFTSSLDLQTFDDLIARVEPGKVT